MSFDASVEGGGSSAGNQKEMFAIPDRVKAGTAEKTWYQLRKNVYTKQDELADAKESGADPNKLAKLEKKVGSLEKQFQILELVQATHDLQLHSQIANQSESSQPIPDTKDLSALSAANILEELRNRWESKLSTTTDPQEQKKLEGILEAGWDLDGMLVQESLSTSTEASATQTDSSKGSATEKPPEQQSSEQIGAGTAGAVEYRLVHGMKMQQISRLQARVEGNDERVFDGKITLLERQLSLLESVRQDHQIDAIELKLVPANTEIPTSHIMADLASSMLMENLVPVIDQLADEYKNDPQKLADIKISQQAAANLDVMLVQESQRVPQNVGEDEAPRIVETKSQIEPEEDLAAMEKRAAELAVVTRAIGKGHLYGMLYPVDKTMGIGHYAGMGFNHGRPVEGDQDAYRSLQKELLPKIPNREINDNRWNERRQVWMVGEHDGQTEYTYYMPTESTWDTRPGIMVMMKVSLPSNVALQIDQMVEKNPLFPNTYFKALFPGIVGEDPTNKIKRKESIDLAIVDARKHPGYEANPEAVETAEIKPYPKPIPY